MSGNRSRKTSETHAEKLRELLTAHLDTPNQPRIHRLQNADGIPSMEDLIQLIQTIENVNQQLLFENKYLKDEMTQTKASVLKLVEENTALHRELKSTTVIEILNEIQQNELPKTESFDQNQLKNKEEELQQSQQLINELQKKLAAELNRKTRTRSGLNGGTNTLENLDSEINSCTKCNEQLEARIKQIDSLKMENEQLIKSKSFLKLKLEESELKENDLISQIKKYVDLVNHLEMEKNQAIAEKEQFKNDKMNNDQKLETVFFEFNENMMKEKKTIFENFEEQIKNLSDQNQSLEEKFLRQESLIDRLTRDKISLISEIENYKSKFNSIDLETHQMVDKLKIKYQEVLKERDISIYESKRIRHDYDVYVKENDQDKFTMRTELNTTRNRLLEVEKDLLMSREQCISLTEDINKLNAEIILLKHSKESVEKSRNESLQNLTDKYEKRENQLATGIEALQARYCITVKELEDLINMQKRLLTKLREECRILNEQLELLAIKYKNDVQYLSNQKDELNTRIGKYEERVKEFEDQNVKQKDLLDRMRERLRELTVKIQDQEDNISKTKSNETLMRNTNIQLMQENETLKKQIDFYTKPIKVKSEENKFSIFKNTSSTPNPINAGEALNSVRSAIENTLNSLKSK